MSETTKCRARCGAETAVGSDCYCQHHLDTPPAPSPEAGEREVREALLVVLREARAGTVELALSLGVMRPGDFVGHDHEERIADALLSRRAPRVEAGEVTIDDAFILAVEEEVGMGNGAWDMVRASDLCRAVLKVAALRTAR